MPGIDTSTVCNDSTISIDIIIFNKQTGLTEKADRIITGLNYLIVFYLIIWPPADIDPGVPGCTILTTSLDYARILDPVIGKPAVIRVPGTNSYIQGIHDVIIIHADIIAVIYMYT